MKTSFKNVLKDDAPDMETKAFDFKMPPYDERSSCYVNAGQKLGVGKKQPVGHEGNPRNSDVIPKGRVKTLEIYPDREKAL